MKPEPGESEDSFPKHDDDSLEIFLAKTSLADNAHLSLSSLASFSSIQGESQPQASTELRNTLSYIFDGQSNDPAELNTLVEGGSICFSAVTDFLRRKLNNASGSGPSYSAINEQDLLNAGKLGPPVVQIQRRSTSGEIKFDSSNLSLTSLGNFSSVVANACSYKGKWMYEVTLGTSGIQQLGWATSSCPFTNEEGVGDSGDSYAFDGKRVRKWNGGSEPYGLPWTTGDVIGCLIDLDDGLISFSQNGASLGTAFRGVKVLQPDVAYFPAISLSHGERCDLNFGARPFLHPEEGYLPLQAPPTVKKQQGSFKSSFDVDSSPTKVSASAQATFLLSCMKRMVQIPPNSHQIPGSAVCLSPLSMADKTVLTSVICEFLGPVLLAGAFARQSRSHSARKEDARLYGGYVVWASLFPFLLEVFKPSPPHNPKLLHPILDLLLVALDQHEIQFTVTALMEVLSHRSRTAGCRAGEEYGFSYPYLALAHALMKREEVMEVWWESRRFVLCLESFLSRKTPNKHDLAVLFPHLWWFRCKEQGWSEELMVQSLKPCCSAVTHTEAMQCAICHLLLTYEPCNPVKTSMGLVTPTAETGGVFIAFLLGLMSKNKLADRKIQPPGLSDPSVLTSMFFVLLRLLTVGPPHSSSQGYLYRQERKRCVPADFFLKSDSLYNSLARIGGTIEHVSKTVRLPVGSDSEELTWADEWAQEQQEGSQSQGSRDKGNDWQAGCGEEEVEGGSGCEEDDGKVPSAPTLCKTSQLEMVEALVFLFHLGPASIYKQTSAVMQSTHQAMSQLELVERQIQSCSDEFALQSLQGARKAALENVEDSLRLTNWATICYFSKWKMDGMFAMSGWIVELLRKASISGGLFSYVPEFYVETLVDSFHALKRCDSSVPIKKQKWNVASLVSFLVTHFNDRRVVNPDVKEMLLQALSTLLSHKDYFVEFEGNVDARERLPSALLTSFDKKHWIPLTQILVRLCRGRTFGEVKGSTLRAVQDSPSVVFQELLKSQLRASPDILASFLNQLFNTVNFTLTQLHMGVKELIESSQQADAPYMVSRKCDVMFDLSVTLLRVVELLAEHVPWGFWEGSDLSMVRLCELILFVLDHTVGATATRLFHGRMLGLGFQGEVYTKETILCPVIGTLVNLEYPEDRHEDPFNYRDIAKMLATFTKIDSVELFLGSFEELIRMDWGKILRGSESLPRLKLLENFVERLSKEVHSVEWLEDPDNNDDEEVRSSDLCSICYSTKVDVTFLPCMHDSCKRCIQRHLLDSHDCFFCKADIEELSPLCPNGAVLGSPGNEVVRKKNAHEA